MIVKPEDIRLYPMKLLVSISIPVFNEAENIDALLERLNGLAETESKYDFEFLFTDNASSDSTFEKLAQKAISDSRIRVLRFSRNYGFQISILMNYLNARGAAAVQIDADLQDPPELISSFLREWEKGYKVVYGIRKRVPEFFLLRWTRRAYYRTVRFLSETDIPVDAGDFRLIDRQIIEELRDVREQTPYLRGLIANMGYAQCGIPYDRTTRQAGTSKFNLLSLISLGLDGITSQSTRPLRVVTLFGVAISIAAFLGVLTYGFIFAIARDNLPDGFTTLTFIGLISLGLNALFIGLVGEYVGRIYNNTRGLPMALIERRIEPFDTAKKTIGDDEAFEDSPSKLRKMHG